MRKLLIAIKAGRYLSYTKWESEKSPSFNPSIAYKTTNGQLYDPATDKQPIHISGPNPRLAAVRETWWQDIKNHSNVTGKFFFGKSDVQPLDDEVNLPVADDYANLALKTKDILRWSTKNGFDYTLLCDDDTAIYVDRLVAEVEAADFDYGGCAHVNVCTGGPGYLISKNAATLCVGNYHTHWAEDVSVGKSCFFNGIKAVMLPGHKSGRSNHHFFIDDVFNPALLDGTEITMHAVFPSAMKAWWAHKQGSHGQTPEDTNR